jgi:hypothetical protein
MQKKAVVWIVLCLAAFVSLCGVVSMVVLQSSRKHRKHRKRSDPSIGPFTKIVSIGGWCGTAFYIKSRGWKTESYPFDWVFASPKVIAHCLNVDFVDYLTPSPEMKALHNHGDTENPAYAAYVNRCIDRFRTLCVSHETRVLFVYITQPIALTSEVLFEDGDMSAMRTALPSKVWLLYIKRALVPHETAETVGDFTVDALTRTIRAVIHTHYHVDHELSDWATKEHYPLFDAVFERIPLAVTGGGGKRRSDPGDYL